MSVIRAKGSSRRNQFGSVGGAQGSARDSYKSLIGERATQIAIRYTKKGKRRAGIEDYCDCCVKPFRTYEEMLYYRKGGYKLFCKNCFFTNDGLKKKRDGDKIIMAEVPFPYSPRTKPDLCY